MIFIVNGCSRYNKLEDALKMAGSNKYELIKVIDHYSRNIDDSLKLKATVFLIENMPGHKSYYGGQVSEYCNKVDSVLDLEIQPIQKRDLIDTIAKGYPNLNHFIVDDINIISADYLIKNIDEVFIHWRTKTWNKGLTFDEFCEYLLPYKMCEYQVIQDWRDSLSAKFNLEFRTNPLYPAFNVRYFPYHPTIEYSEKIKKEIGINLTHYDHYRFFSASSLSRMAYGICDDYVALGVGVLRSHGIPVVTEYLPSWTSLDMGHRWFSILNKGKNIPSPWGVESRPGDPFFHDNLYPKVFRYTYAPESKYIEYLSEAKYIHPSVSPFRKDITANYVRTANFHIPIDYSMLKDKYVYIAIHDNIRWSIVDIGVVRNKKAIFENMGMGIVYLIFGFNGSSLVPVSIPFLADFDGTIKYLELDHKELQSVALTRKFPRKDIVDIMEEKVIGGKIQASNRSDFSKCTTFYTIDSLMFPDIVQFVNSEKYRYWRYYSPPGSNCNIAELQFFEKSTSCEIPVLGKIIGTTDDVWENSSVWKKENAFDGDWLTMFQYAKEDGGWIGLDLGFPKCIDRFRCVPRSDDNGIHYGDLYELMYWNNGKWQSLGRQIAKGKVLIFDHVPKGALLLLKNHTRGRQERTFTYENGMQIWK